MEDKEINIEELFQDVDLSNLNDKQNMLLSLVAYLDINEEGKQKIANGESIKLSEISQYLENPDNPYFGPLGFADKGLAEFDNLRSKDSPLSLTERELLGYLVNSGLGEIKITDISDKRGIMSSGFQAMSFEDSHGNVGVSYRGSDFDFSKGGIRDWLKANILEYFTGTSTQADQAKEYFDAHKHPDGQTYIYGGSLGGNLCQHVYLEKYDEIARVFTFNGNPINEKALDTPEKIAAFNDPEKANFCVICGDPISALKSSDLYKNNITYVKNDGIFTGIESHFAEAASYDNNGNFIQATREEAIASLTPQIKVFTDLSQSVRGYLNEMETFFDSTQNSRAASFVRDFANDFTTDIKTLFEEIKQCNEHIKSGVEEIDIDKLFDMPASSLNNSLDLEELFIDGAHPVEAITDWVAEIGDDGPEFNLSPSLG
jgi:hypothetical protein